MRLRRDKYFMELAFTTSKMADIHQKEGHKIKPEGCIFVSKDNRVLVTGFNEIIHLKNRKPFLIEALINCLFQCERLKEVDKVYCTSFPTSKARYLLKITACTKMIYSKALLKRGIIANEQI